MKSAKRLTSIILSLAMLLSLVACGTSVTSDPSRKEQLPVENVAGERDVVSYVTGEKTDGKSGTALISQVPGQQDVFDNQSVVPGVQTNGYGGISNDPVGQISNDRSHGNVGSVVVPTYTNNDAVSEPGIIPEFEVTEPKTSNPVLSDDRDTFTPHSEYNKGVVLVKVKESFDEKDLGTLEYICAEPMYKGSKWYTVQIADAEKTQESVTYLSGLDTFEKVDYDYIMGVTADIESADVSSNPEYSKQTAAMDTHFVKEAWDYIRSLGKRPGGSSDVVVAVIDTGVDYNHLDLRNNIWINTAEIPGNGIDDDGNGYVDDVYGWNCVGDNNDPMDDNGHGTHVAGIIAAENNLIGGVGVAYNCKVMCLKAGNSSGHFNNSDIAEAIQYAYMNGASVINMSFGGSMISIAVEEALENAYNQCVLVAAAGNDGTCIGGCAVHPGGISYPAALPYVIGVMSVDPTGLVASSFSNLDHTSPYDSTEYEVFAVGESVFSTWPNNKYAILNGTSMAAPQVSGIAALLRSAYPDREVYSTKYLQSQIVNTGTVNPYIPLWGIDEDHSVANVYESLTKLPKPGVNLYDYYIDDSVSISPKNNGNGVIDAGETVRLYISLHNRGGVATGVKATIDTIRNNDPSLTDPYFTFVNSYMEMSDIGTYSVRESGDKYFEIIVSGDCPNDYLADFNIHYTYTNGMDDKDTAVYTGYGKVQLNVSSGYHLPGVIKEDTTFTNDRLYIVGEDVVIPAGVTVTFKEGCRIQFYDDREYYNSPVITVYGTLNMEGTKDNMVSIAPSERHAAFVCGISNYGNVMLSFISCVNLDVRSSGDEKAVFSIWNSNLYNQTIVDKQLSTATVLRYSGGELVSCGMSIYIQGVYNSYIELLSYSNIIYVSEMKHCYIKKDIGSHTFLECHGEFSDNIVYFERLSRLYSGDVRCYGKVENNFFISSDDSATSLEVLAFYEKTTVTNNTFSTGYQKYASQVIKGYYDTDGNPTVDVYGSCSDISKLWPHIANVEIFDKDGNPVTTVGREEIRVRVTFNRSMDISVNPGVFFGTIEPYADYKIEGAYVSDTVWEGTYSLKAYIENGLQKLIVKGACAAEDPTKTIHGECQLYEFNIDTTSAMSMNLQAIAKDNGIELTWNQDDYATLMGYNIYRSEEKDGNYVKLNPAILLPDDESFLDDNAEPGKSYWYTFTVVLSDFSESSPAGKIMATAKDTMAPSLYHTPVNQGYENNNLVISCTASDNIRIASVILYYRTVGNSEWKTLTMSKVNDKYNATIFGSDLTPAGLEYYIVASDGVNAVFKGSAEKPYSVVIKNLSAVSRLGDVDGDGVVGTKDALMLIMCLNGDLLLEDDAFKRADLNGDGALSSMEALRILQYVNGKVTSLEM